MKVSAERFQLLITHHKVLVKRTVSHNSSKTTKLYSRTLQHHRSPHRAKYIQLGP